MLTFVSYLRGVVVRNEHELRVVTGKEQRDAQRLLYRTKFDCLVTGTVSYRLKKATASSASHPNNLPYQQRHRLNELYVFSCLRLDLGPPLTLNIMQVATTLLILEYGSRLFLSFSAQGSARIILLQVSLTLPRWHYQPPLWPTFFVLDSFTLHMAR